MVLTSELLIHCIILLLNAKTPANQGIVRSLITIYDEDVRREGLKDDNVAVFFVKAIRTILARGIDRSDQVALSSLLIEFKSDPALEARRDLYELLVKSLQNTEATPEAVAYSREKVRMAVLQHNLHRTTRTMFGKLATCQDVSHPDDMRSILSQVIRHAKEMESEFQRATPLTGPPGMVDRVNFADPSSLAQAMEKHTTRNVEGVMKLGLQGMNKMFGPAGGIVRGETVVFNASSHNFKSGMLQSIAMWVACYNVPIVKDVRKKPMILFVSLENEAFQNMYWIFKQLYWNRHGTPHPPGMTHDQIVTWVMQFFEERGYHLEIVRYLPETFGSDELKLLVEWYEGLGYELHLLIIDYMNKMRKGSIHMSRDAPDHLLVQQLYSSICNYTKNKLITMVTAHQLNRDADKLKAVGTTNIVKQLGPSHLGASVGVQQEVDIAVYMHIEATPDGQVFLTMRKDKHRYVDGMPEKDKYVAYRFTPYGIKDDIMGVNECVRDIYAHAFDQMPDAEAIDDAALTF